MMNFLKRFVMEPIDDIWFSHIRMLERLGIDERVNSLVYKQSVITVGSLLKNLYNFEVVNAENIPKDGRLIMCFNHQSELDVIAFGIAAAYPLSRNNSRDARHLYQMAKVALFNLPLINAWVRTHFAFPLNRGEHDILSYQKTKRLLTEEKMIGIYPEGTINPGNGKFLEGHVGAVRLAYETNAPILPAAIFGTDRIYGKGAKFPRFQGKIKVTFGELMNHNDIFKDDDSNAPKFYNKAINRVMRRIKDIYFEMFQKDNEKRVNKNKPKQN
ncbi:MAG: lysophospholipid acyltransferase family protein [Promethearchaeota archaeon]